VYRSIFAALRERPARRSRLEVQRIAALLRPSARVEFEGRHRLGGPTDAARARTHALSPQIGAVARSGEGGALAP